jgi:hypothetical protein
MSTNTLHRVATSFRNNTRLLVDAFLKRSESPKQHRISTLEAMEPRQMLSAIPGFVNTFGSPVAGSHEFSGNYVNDIAIDADGNSYTVGVFRGSIDFDPSAGVNKLTASNQNGDAFIAKFSASGALTWVRQLETVATSSSSEARGVSIDSTGNVYVIGTYTGTLTVDFGDGATNLTSAGDTDIFMAKINADSSLAGVVSIGSTGSESVSQIVSRQGGEGGFVVLGSTNAKLDLDASGSVANISPITTSSVSFAAVYDFHLNYDGVITLHNSTGFSNFGGAFVDDSAAGKVVLSFGFNGAGTVDFGNDSKLADFTGEGVMILQLDASGDGGPVFEWAKTFASTDFISAGPVALDATGNLYVGLNIAGSADINPGAATKTVTSATGSFSPTLLSLDKSGNFRWGHMVGGSEGEVRSIAVSSDGAEIYSSGYFRGTAQFDIAGSAAGKRTATKPSGFIWVVNADGSFKAAGAFYSAAAGKHTGYADVRALAINADDDIVLAGSFNGTVDFDASTGTRKVTSVSDGVSDDVFIMNITGSGTADTGSGVVPPSTDTFSQGKNLVITDAAGNKVTLSLTGSGTGVITRTAGATGDIASVTITGSKSTSSFTVTVSGTANGGTTNIGSIAIGTDTDATTDSIGAITASKVNIGQGSVNVEGSANSITLNSLSDVLLDVGAAPTAGTAFKFGTVLNASIMVSGAIASIDATDWDTNLDTRGNIHATSLGRVTSKGDFEVNLTLSGAAKGATLGAATITGAVNGTKWDINGSTGAIKAGGFDHFVLEADIVQSFSAGTLGLMDASLTFKSVGAFTVAGSLNGVDLILQATGASGKLVSNLTSFSVTGTTNELFVATGANTNLGAFTFKGSASHVQISGSTAGGISGITGSTIDSLTVSTGTLGPVNFSGNASHVILASAIKAGAVTFKGDLSEAIVNLTGAPTKAQTSLTSFTVGGNTTDLTVNSSNANNALGAFTLTKIVDNVDFNVAGDITSIKTGSAHALHVNKVGKVGSITVNGDLTGGTIDALAITGAFSISGKATDNDITLNTSRPVAQPTTFKALGSMTIGGAVSGINISASGINSYFGAITIKNTLASGNFSTPSDIAGITALSGTNLNIDAANLKALSFGGNVNSISIQSATIGGFTAKGNLADANIVIVNGATKDITAIGPVTISGTTSNVSILSPNTNANIGALSLGTSVSNVVMNIGGDIASFKAGAVDKLNIMGPGTIGAFTVGGAFTNSEIDVLSLGNTTISGNVNKVGLTLNTEQPAQPATFKALGGLTISGTTASLTLTAVGANSNTGALTFSKGITNSSVFDIRGTITSLTSKATVDSFIGTFGDLKALTVTGGLSNSILTANTVGAVTVNGNVNGVNLSLNPSGSASSTNKALASLQVNGSSTNLVISGNGLNSNVGSINITGTAVGTQIDINGTVAKLAALSFDANTAVGILGKLSALVTGKSGHLNGSFNVDSFGSITVGGDLLADLRTVGAAGIGAVSVTGNINGALIRTLGSITSITANAILHSNILSGYDNALGVPTSLPTAATGFINNTAVIGTVTIKSTGNAASFVDTRIMGVKIGNASLKVVETDNDGSVFGLSATKQLGPVSRTGAATVAIITTTAQSRQFGDFAIRIVA